MSLGEKSWAELGATRQRQARLIGESAGASADGVYLGG